MSHILFSDNLVNYAGIILNFRNASLGVRVDFEAFFFNDISIYITRQPIGCKAQLAAQLYRHFL